MASASTPTLRTRLLTAATTLALLASLPGCENMENAPKNIGDYFNFRNSFLDPSQVGRFDKANPWGSVKPVTWPILDQLDVVDETVDRWANATDPLPSDLVTDTKEYVVGEGDQVRVSVFELVTPGMEYFKEVQVNELGNISLQNLGQVHVAGLTPTQIEEKVGQIAVEKGLLLPKGGGNAGPQVGVTLLSSRARIFSILGQVGAAGTYNIIGTDFRLLDALALARDIAGGSQPGLDYVYVIRQQKGAGVIPAQQPADMGAAPTAPTTPPPPAPTRSNPLDALESIEKGDTKPAPTTAPASQPGSEAPQLIRELPKAVVMSGTDGIRLAQADLDAALGGGPGAASATAAATPGNKSGFVFKDGKWVEESQTPTTAPAAAVPPATPSTEPAAPKTASTPAATGEANLNQAIEGSTQKPGFIFVDGKWVEAGNPAVPAGIAGNTNMSTAEAVAAATGVTPPRVIRIPLNALKEGVAKYNVVIRPGDVINVPNIEPGEFYMLGHVGRPGVYSLTGRKVTLKQAVAAAGGLDGLAIPRRCELIRRIGLNQEVTVQVDLQRIFDGEQPDIFLKANDLVNVGTDLIAPFLAVTRNAYRASYGWGFVYDRNFYITPTIVQ